MTGYVANLLSCEALKGIRNELAEFQIDESLLTVMFHRFKSRKYPSKSKICFLALVVEIFEKDIEILNLQIESYSFQDPKKFMENLPSPKQEEILLPCDLQIDQNFVL